jgi:hypothetical protein
LPQFKGSMKDLETMTKKWLRLMWEAASGGRTRQRALWRLRRKTISGIFSCYSLMAIVPAHGVFGKTHIFPRDPFARRRRPPTLVGSKVSSKFMIFNVNSLNRHFKILAEKTRSWDIAARNTELRSEAGAASPIPPTRQAGLWRFRRIPLQYSIFLVPCSLFAPGRRSLLTGANLWI